MNCPERLLIPYGASRLSPRFFDVVRNADGEAHIDCRVPHVIIRPARRRQLRLNDAGALLTRPATADGQVDPTDQVSLLRGAFEDLCGLWWPVGRCFVSTYFELVESIVEEHRRGLESRLVEFGALYHYRDWIYSAPAPLPRAWIPAAEVHDPSGAPESFVACDFAFWTGDAIVAAWVTGTETDTTARLRDAERLRGAGVRTVEIPHFASAAQRRAALRERLPVEFLSFWEGERYPSGPSWTSMAGAIVDRDA